MKNQIKIFLLSLSLCAFANAQSSPVKTYYGNSNKVKSEISYSDSVRDGKAIFYYPNGNIKQELTYENGKAEGLVKEYYENGKLRITYNVENGKRDGPASLFDTSGNYIKDIAYENGIPQPGLSEESFEETDSTGAMSKQDTSSQKIAELKKKAEGTALPSNIEGKSFAAENGYLTTAEVMPEPVGGMKAIYNKLVYPADARKNEIQGTVEVRAYVDEYGEVQKAEIVKGLGHGCDEAARIAVYYAMFKPGMVNGKAAKVVVTIPVQFKLEK